MQFHKRYIGCIKFVRSRQPGIISLMSYSLLWFVKINTELLRGVFTTQREDTRLECRNVGSWIHLEGALYLFLQTRVTSKTWVILDVVFIHVHNFFQTIHVVDNPISLDIQGKTIGLYIHIETIFVYFLQL